MIIKQNCAACGGKNMISALDLGKLPNSNEFVYKKDLKNIRYYPLKYYWCKDCGLFQQLELVDSKTLFRDNYTYQTGVNLPGVIHFRELSRKLKKELVRKCNFAIVIGSNDGTELELLKEAGFKKALGVEPAKNIAEIANRKGLETINAFFTQKLSKEIIKKYGKADLITANNVFAHIPDPKDMLLGMRTLLNPNGKIVIEVQWFRDVIRKNSIDTLYSEHYYEWTIKAMISLARRCGLKVIKVTRLPKQQGGSIRFYLGLKGKTDKKLESLEQKAGVYNKNKILSMQIRSEKRKIKLIKLLTKLKTDGNIIAIWAVPAKVSTVLNFSGINSKFIDYAFDATPTKINRYIPMAGIKILDEKLLNANMKNRLDYIIIGAWNYLDFAKKKLSWFTDSGGKLINLLNGKIISQ